MEIKDQIEKLGTEIKSENTELKNELQGKLDAFQKQFDELATKSLSINAQPVDFKNEFKSAINATNGIALGSKYEVKAALKPQADMKPEQASGIYGYANVKVNARDLFSIGSTSADAYVYVKESGYTQAAGIKLEGAKAGESSFGIKKETALVSTISTFLVVSKEMLSDVDGITSYLQNRVPAKLAEKESQEILFGTGDIKGVSTTATPFSATTITLTSGTTANEYDVLRVAVDLVSKANYSATAILVNGTDKTKLELAKDSTGAYLFPAGNMSVAGIPIVESNSMTEGSFLVGDFRMGAEIKEREGLVIEFYNQDADNVQKGLVTVGVTERIALPVYHNGAFVSGTFAAGKTKIKG
ncbi:phage major capsid protein [bacterium]|nr:MAG: phage major capsid protein [bacterium]